MIKIVILTILAVVATSLNLSAERWFSSQFDWTHNDPRTVEYKGQTFASCRDYCKRHVTAWPGDMYFSSWKASCEEHIPDNHPCLAILGY